jgi:hypothetical protein
MRVSGSGAFLPPTIGTVQRRFAAWDADELIVTAARTQTDYLFRRAFDTTVIKMMLPQSSQEREVMRRESLIAIALLANCTVVALAQDASYSPPPTPHPHACDLQRVQWIYFTRGTSSMNGDFLTQRIRTAAVLWRENQGYILLRGHIAEDEREISGLDTLRIDAVRAELMALGVHEDAIWTSAVGTADIDPSWEQTNPTAGKRRVDLIVTNPSDRCLSGIRQALALWALENCLPGRAVDDQRTQDCESAIRSMAR